MQAIFAGVNAPLDFLLLFATLQSFSFIIWSCFSPKFFISIETFSTFHFYFIGWLTEHVQAVDSTFGYVILVFSKNTSPFSDIFHDSISVMSTVITRFKNAETIHIWLWLGCKNISNIYLRWVFLSPNAKPSDELLRRQESTDHTHRQKQSIKFQSKNIHSKIPPPPKKKSSTKLTHSVKWPHNNYSQCYTAAMDDPQYLIIRLTPTPVYLRLFF